MPNPGDKTQADHLLASLADAVFVIAPDGYIRAANPSADSLIATVPTDARRLGVLPGFAPDDRRRLVDAHAEQRRVSASWTRGGLRYLATLRPLSTGEMSMSLCPAASLVEDADSEWVQTPELARLRAMDEVKSGVIARVAQEIRAPLASIKSFAKILWMNGDRLEPTRRQAFLQIVNGETDKLTRLIEDVLDISRMEAGTMSWQVEPVDLSEVIEQSVAANRATAQSKDVTLILEPFAAGRLPVRSDRDKLIQAISHLIANGIKFTAEGGRVVVSAVVEGPQVHLQVRDTGIGIAEADLARIFEPYYQIAREAEADGPQDGVGLGLSIARQIVSHAGGRVWAESAPGSGSTFHLTLPMAGDA